jgi:hypothetical protein
MIQIYLGKQPHRNQTVTYDPKVGFILDPVNEEDTGYFRCKGTNKRHYYNSRLSYDEMEMRLGDLDTIKFTLDVSKYFTNCRLTCQNVRHLYCCFEYGSAHPTCLLMSYNLFTIFVLSKLI